MAYICLLLSGAALLINGLAALDLVPRRDAAVFSLVIGSAQLILGTLASHLGTVTAGRRRDAVLLAASGMFLFGLTYVYVGLDFLLGLGSRGLGWFCGMVGACGILLAAAWSGEDPLLAVLWLCWTYLWLLFFLQLALGIRAPDAADWLVPWSSPARHRPRCRRSWGSPGSGRPASRRPAAAGAGLAALLLLAGGLAWRGEPPQRGRCCRRRTPVTRRAPAPVSPPCFSTTISTSTPATNITGTATSSPTAVSALPPIRDVKLLTTR